MSFSGFYAVSGGRKEKGLSTIICIGCVRQTLLAITEADLFAASLGTCPCVADIYSSSRLGSWIAGLCIGQLGGSRAAKSELEANNWAIITGVKTTNENGNREIGLALTRNRDRIEAGKLRRTSIGVSGIYRINIIIKVAGA